MNNDDLTAYFSVNNLKLVTLDMAERVLASTPYPFDSLLASVVLLRTYSRWIPQLKRRESWMEICARVTDFSFSLSEFCPTQPPISPDEVFEFLSSLYSMKFLVAGRTLWRGKAPIDATANYNCSFVTLDSLNKLPDIFYLLLSGAGVGFSLESKFVQQLPPLRRVVTTIKPYSYQPLADENKNDNTELILTSKSPPAITVKSYGKETIFEGDIVSGIQNDLLAITEDSNPSTYYSLDIRLGDSRHGWTNAIAAYFAATQVSKITAVNLSFNKVRPSGRLKTMGGWSSGPQPLIDAFRKIIWLIHKMAVRTQWANLTHVDWLDIVTFLAEAVVSGGVRRSSLIALSESDEVLNCKAGLFDSLPSGKSNLLENTDLWAIDHPSWLHSMRVKQIDMFNPKYRYQTSRVLVNISRITTQKPTKAAIKKWVESGTLQQMGEPGLFNLEAAKKRYPRAEGTNPCGEILLADRQCCNLSEIPIPRLEGATKRDFLKEFKRVVNIVVPHQIRLNTTVLFSKLWTNKTNNIGVSLCGYKDFELTHPWIAEALPAMKAIVITAALNAAKKYGITALHPLYPEIFTTIKPGGTLPLIAGVSSGIMPSYAPFYIRRVRMLKDDPLAVTLKRLGLPVEPTSGYANLDVSPLWVFSFPIKKEVTTRAVDVSAIAQLEDYKTLATQYCDNNCSVTISCDFSTETAGITNWLFKNWDDIVGLTLFPKFDSDTASNTGYTQLPFESITESQYNDLLIAHPALVTVTEPDILLQLKTIEIKLEIEKLQLTDSACVGGACPIR